MEECSLFVYFRTLLIMIYFPSFKLLYFWLLIQTYSLDSIFIIECPWRNVLALFSFRDLLDLDVSHLPKWLLRWERANYRIQVRVSLIQHRNIEIVNIMYMTNFIYLVFPNSWVHCNSIWTYAHLLALTQKSCLQNGQKYVQNIMFSPFFYGQKIANQCQMILFLAKR